MSRTDPQRPRERPPSTAYHPELAAKARWIPRGLPGRWALPIVRRLWRLSVPRTAAQVVHLDGCQAFVYRTPRPAEARGAALLWIHGGGLVLGDAREDDAFVSRIVSELRVPAVSVQYRLAPEHPFPTPLHDCVRAFDWLAERPDVDPARILVAGKSAGGGLAAALCQLLRDRGGHQPAFQLLVYPMLDDRTAWMKPRAGDRLHRGWDRKSNAIGWSSYLRGHAEPPEYAVPARATDLSGLPPAWIGAAELDLFLEEDLDYARRLEAAGVPVTTAVVPGAYHGFDKVDAKQPVARRFRAAQLAALRRSARARSPCAPGHTSHR